jgi:hypothetical protein
MFSLGDYYRVLIRQRTSDPSKRYFIVAKYDETGGCLGYYCGPRLGIVPVGRHTFAYRPSRFRAYANALARITEIQMSELIPSS